VTIFIENKRGVNVIEFEEIIGYKFKDKSLIRTSMTHSSYANENKGSGVRSYERLEFLGDAILGFITAEFLFRNRRNAEGDLTKMRAGIVCEANLVRVAEKLSIGKFLLLGKGEEQSQGRKRQSILADVVEAIIGAIYIDSGIDEARKFIERFILSDAADVSPASSRDYKTELQELIQRVRDNSLGYQLVAESGPDHNKTFEIEALVNGKPVGRGKGRSKKEAEQAAARDALKRIGKRGIKG
jgi:ribonuclease-3